mmetsp:Transcript_62194/g.160357  ORF Transcript_62194/g.160357 Transcript_62194/m.160357 type:complete len:220 (+) Transcript_62194:65-724(+)|eukprot:CAMPEP_0195068118 /NCGR_PEP_ID=MMETSP0448-20130528/12955_1 /TAXON_ID=66468 /ORGANISM="Heterocapsa triquestra, Strain CCMP 448" /LENGTH=219 /DNA_ID=CAMNT_0040099629 /DNA_START=65 /DNA_END=724 /DNA_ORIENTATION=+
MALLSPPMLPAAALYRRATISVTAAASPAARCAPLLPAAALRQRSSAAGGLNGERTPANGAATTTNAAANPNMDSKLLHRLWAPRQGITCASPMAGSPMVGTSPLRSPSTRKNQQLPGGLTFTGCSPVNGGPFWHKSPTGAESVASNRTNASNKKTPKASSSRKPRRCRVHFDSPLCQSFDVTPYEELYGSHPNSFNFDAVGNMIPPSPLGYNSPIMAA